jgi:hypothetical protein
MLKLSSRQFVWGLLTIGGLAQQSPPEPATVMAGLDKQLHPKADAWLHYADPRVQA